MDQRKEIVLDTNFVLAGFENPIHPINEVRNRFPTKNIYIPDAVKKELDEKLGEKMCSNLLETRNLEILETEIDKDADNLLLELSEKFTVATNDKNLKKKIIERDNDVLTIRSRGTIVRED